MSEEQAIETKGNTPAIWSRVASLICVVAYPTSSIEFLNHFIGHIMIDMVWDIGVAYPADSKDCLNHFIVHKLNDIVRDIEIQDHQVHQTLQFEAVK